MKQRNTPKYLIDQILSSRSRRAHGWMLNGFDGHIVHVFHVPSKAWFMFNQSNNIASIHTREDGHVKFNTLNDVYRHFKKVTKNP